MNRGNLSGHLGHVAKARNIAERREMHAKSTTRGSRYRTSTGRAWNIYEAPVAPTMFGVNCLATFYSRETEVAYEFDTTTPWDHARLNRRKEGITFGEDQFAQPAPVVHGTRVGRIPPCVRISTTGVTGAFAGL
ncbi:hypothetical protein DFH06DRAFT_1128886 [Mycena polygramma]|nr:hypothetical protein DFH06DRAFT_1128886 [Mycena polygramma]